MSIYQTTEYDYDDLYDWYSIQYTIENDVVIRTRATYDANYEIFSEFENGILVQEYTTGDGAFDALGYEYRFVQFDSTGVTTSRLTGYPDDLSVSETFENGIRTETKITDGIYGDNVQPWTEIVLTYDATGTNIVSRTTTYDDGTILTDGFGDFGGLRSETIFDLDQTKNWLSQDKHYDYNGDLEYRRIDYDNGIVRQDFYEGGQRFATAKTDNVYSNNDGIKSWTYIASEFDADGKLAARTTQYDNGVLKTEAWEGGLRISFLQEDTENAKNWITITRSYDENGVIARQDIDYDNGDVTVNLYTDGARTQRLQLDGNDSSSWLVQVTDWGPEGKTVTRYNSVEEIPVDIFPYFDGLEPPVQLTEMVLDFNDGMDILNGWTTLDDTFVVDVGQGESGLQGRVMTNEYGGATEQDADLEAFNSWGATVGFEMVDGGDFDFASISLANASKSDTQYIPEYKWANQVTINGYNDGVLVDQMLIDLTFDHVTHDVGFEGIDRLELVASGGGVTNQYVENAGWFSMDDLTFLA